MYVTWHLADHASPEHANVVYNYRLYCPSPNPAGPRLLYRLPGGPTIASLHVTLTRTFWHVGDWKILLFHESTELICFCHIHVAFTSLPVHGMVLQNMFKLPGLILNLMFSACTMVYASEHSELVGILALTLLACGKATSSFYCRSSRVSGHACAGSGSYR